MKNAIRETGVPTSFLVKDLKLESVSHMLKVVPKLETLTSITSLNWTYLNQNMFGKVDV